jgi:hypothetical protein
MEPEDSLAPYIVQDVPNPNSSNLNLTIELGIPPLTSRFPKLFLIFSFPD